MRCARSDVASYRSSESERTPLAPTSAIEFLPMSRVIVAEYDAQNRALKLEEPLTGVKDHEKVRVAIEEGPSVGIERPWMALAGSLPEEAAEEWLRTLREASRPDDL